MKKMQAWQKLLLLLILVISIPVLWWKVQYPSGSWNYKMTVTVETPEGVVPGEAVRTVSYHTEPRILPPQGGINYGIREGEAVVIDLGERGVLFALLRGKNLSSDYAYRVALEHLKAKYGKRTMKPVGKQVSLPQRDWPMFVTFEDFDDPVSVVEIDSSNIEDFFGEGVSIKNVVIKITDESIKWKIHKYISWIDDLKMKYLHGGSTGGKAPLGLHGGHFIIKGY